MSSRPPTSLSPEFCHTLVDGMGSVLTPWRKVQDQAQFPLSALLDLALYVLRALVLAFCPC